MVRALAAEAAAARYKTRARAHERASARADRPKSADCVVHQPLSEIYVYDMRDLLSKTI